MPQVTPREISIEKFLSPSSLALLKNPLRHHHCDEKSYRNKTPTDIEGGSEDCPECSFVLNKSRDYKSCDCCNCCGPQYNFDDVPWVVNHEQQHPWVIAKPINSNWYQQSACKNHKRSFNQLSFMSHTQSMALDAFSESDSSSVLGREPL